MVLPDEEDRGELYPILTTNDETFTKYFGLGVGMYMYDLKLLSLFFSICGLIMIPAFVAYTQSRSGVWSFTAYCDDPIQVTATLGCGNNNGGSSSSSSSSTNSNTTCIGYYRENCFFPSNAILSDIIMSLIFFLLNIVAIIYDQYYLDKIDNSIQTAKDYTVVIKNPPINANDIEKWYDFFKIYGKIRSITIHKDNAHLINLLIKTHVLIKKKEEYSRLLLSCNISNSNDGTFGCFGLKNLQDKIE